MKIVDVERLPRIAEVEFSDIVLDAYASDINMTMRPIVAGRPSAHFRTIFMTAARQTLLKVTLIRTLKAHCASF